MKRSISIVISLMISMIILSASVTAVFADDTVRNTDVTAAYSGNTLVLIEGKFTYLSKDKILEEINRLRLEACQEGCPDPRDSSRKLTEADYVPMKWSGDLEWIAQTRAAEGCVYMWHTRPNGRSWAGIGHNGYYSSQESLAWNSKADILLGIDQWDDEKNDWVNQKAGATTGHYTAMIDPSNTCVGIGAFKMTSGYGTVAAEFSSYTNPNETQNDPIGECSQVVEVNDSRLKVEVEAPQQLHKGKEGTAELKATTNYVYKDRDVTANVELIGDVSWSSSDTSVATIDADGNICGVSTGTAVITASVNGNAYTGSVEVADHTWNEELTVAKEASCIEEGSAYISCSVCGEKKSGSDTVIEKTGHSYGSWTTEKKATCVEVGVQKKVCTVCGSAITKEIPKTDHKWNTYYTVDKEPTETEAGSKSIHCSVCDAIKEGSSVAVDKMDPDYYGYDDDDWYDQEYGEVVDLPAVRITKPKAAKKSATIKWKKVSKKKRRKIAGIQIQYSTDLSFSTDVSTVTAKKTASSKKIKKLASKRKYYVRVRAYKKAGRVTHVSRWSKVRAVKIK